VFWRTNWLDTQELRGPILRYVGIPLMTGVVLLDEPVFSIQNAVQAFRLLSSEDAICDWDAGRVVELIESTDDELKQWRTWMGARYFG